MHIDNKLWIMLLILSISSGNLFHNNKSIILRAGSAAYPRYLRRNLHGCLPDDIMSQCSQSNDRYDECARELCSRCILQASVLNPFAEYCYWMMSCLCTVTNCQDLSQSDCY